MQGGKLKYPPPPREGSHCISSGALGMGPGTPSSGLGESSIAQRPAVPLLVWGWKRQGRDWRTFATSSFFFPFYDLCGPESCFSNTENSQDPWVPVWSIRATHMCPHPSEGTATPALWLLRKKILTRSYLSYKFKISFRRLQNLVNSWTHLNFSICHSVSRRLMIITYNPPWLKQRHQVNTEHLLFFLPTFAHMNLPPLHTHTHTHTYTHTQRKSCDNPQTLDLKSISVALFNS